MLATLRHRDFGLLWFAGLISIGGDFMLRIALPLHAFRLTGDTLATAGVLVAAFLPRVLLGSVVGVFVDRWDRKRIMIVADLLRAVLLLPLLLVRTEEWLWLLYLATAVENSIGLFFSPAENALLPNLVGEERLVSANALNALNDNLGRLVGPALGGALYAWRGLDGIVIVDALTYLGSAALIARIATDARPRRTDAPADQAATAWARAIGEWREGLRVVAHHPILRVIFLSLGIGFLGEGTFSALMTPLIVGPLGGDDVAVGLLASAQAISGLGAAAVVSQAGRRVSAHVLFAGGMIGLGLTDLGVSNAANLVEPGTPALVLGAVFFFFSGLPVVAAQSARATLLQRLTEDSHRGRVFASLGTIQSVAILIGLLAGGLLGDRVGIVALLSVGALCWLFGGAIALLRLPHDRSLGESVLITRATPLDLSADDPNRAT